MTKRIKDIFQPKSSRLVRVLLTNPGARWRILTLAKEAEVSLGWAHAVITTLQEQGYVVRDTNYQISVVDPARLLRRWAAYHSFLSENKFEPFHTFERELEQLLQRLKKIRAPYALTTLVGAWLVAPQVRPATVDIYVVDKSQASEIAKTMELRTVEKGGNVRFVLPYDAGVFYGSRIVGRLTVVSNVQLYVDLVNYPARGEEASEHLFRLIQDEWSKALVS